MRWEAIAVVLMIAAAPLAAAGAEVEPGRVLLFEPAAGSNWIAGMFRHEAADFSADGWTAVEFDVIDVSPDALAYLVVFDVFFDGDSYAVEEALPFGGLERGSTGAGAISGSTVTPRTFLGHFFLASSDDPAFRVAIEITPSNTIYGGIDLSYAQETAPLISGSGASLSYVSPGTQGPYTRGIEYASTANVIIDSALGEAAVQREIVARAFHSGGPQVWQFTEYSASGAAARVGQTHITVTRGGDVQQGAPSSGSFHGPSTESFGFEFEGAYVVEGPSSGFHLRAATIPVDIAAFGTS